MKPGNVITPSGKMPVALWESRSRADFRKVSTPSVKSIGLVITIAPPEPSWSDADDGWVYVLCNGALGLVSFHDVECSVNYVFVVA